jgi:hypothetical protein
MVYLSFAPSLLVPLSIDFDAGVSSTIASLMLGD